MKVKLLKKLRKRFIWLYRPGEMYNPWQVFDKITDRQVFGLPEAGYWYTERTILMMLRIIGFEHLWQSRSQKFEKIRIAKLQKERKEQFYNHQNKP